MKNVCLLLFVCTSISLFGASHKKIIAGGFEISLGRTRHIAKHLDQFEKLPLDGLCIFMHLPYVKYGPAGNNFSTSPVRWEKKWFTREIENLRKISSGRLKHNFLNVFWSLKKRMDWNDNDAWAKAIHNVGVMAWVIREGGGKGLLFDVEDYNRTRQFRLVAGDKPYDETAALARKRGAELMTRLAAEYPDITLMTFMLFCESNLLHKGRNVFAVAKETGDLWIPFINGMLDKIPPRAKIVEGNEHSYWMNACTNDYIMSLADMKVNYARMAYPENLSKYRNQVSAAFAFYLDIFSKGIKKKKASKEDMLARFRLNLGDAVRFSDEYVWLWGESQRWLNNWDAEASKGLKSIKPETWEQVVPGFNRSIELVQNSKKIAMRQEKNAKNLIKNPEFKKSLSQKNKTAGEADWAKGTLPAGWSFYPAKEVSKVRVVVGKGFNAGRALESKGVSKGCFLTRIPVKSGRFYAIEAFVKGTGKKMLTVRWQKNKGWLRQWAGTYDEIMLFEKADKNGWSRVFVTVQAPAEAARMVILLNVRQKKDEVLFFDRIKVFEVK